MSITVVLLAAGYATRLYPLTKDRPKALLPLGRGVILDAVMERVAEAMKLQTGREVEMFLLATLRQIIPALVE